jgi:RNA polymerase sigma-70 factor (ECF subfamily)
VDVASFETREGDYRPDDSNAGRGVTGPFEASRSRLIAVAYGMLGSMMDAEDIVQDAWIRWSSEDRSEIESPPAFLTTMVTRMSIDRLRSAQKRRETHIGPWLPEPIVAGADPADIVAEAEQFSLGFLQAMEGLNPVERAVFLLREGFDFDYSEIASIVDRSPDNCRQLASRARGHIAHPPRKAARDLEAERAVVIQALMAVTIGDVEGLVELLASDVVSWSDGGPKRRAARYPVVGAHRVARFLIGLSRNGQKLSPTTFMVTVNGEPAVQMEVGGERYGVMAFEVVEGRIQGIRNVVNPDKLAYLH